MFTGFGVHSRIEDGRLQSHELPQRFDLPDDNAIVAAGLMRYGFVTQAQRIVWTADLSSRRGGRLPAGLRLRPTGVVDLPVDYPLRGLPQAWSALLRSICCERSCASSMGALREGLCDPAVPKELLPLRIDRLDLAGSKVTIDITDDGWHVEGLPDGMVLEPTPRHPITAADTGLKP